MTIAHDGQTSMTALPREDEPSRGRGIPLHDGDPVGVGLPSSAEQGRGHWPRALSRGIAIAKATNKCLRNEVIRCSYNLVPEEALAEKSVNSPVLRAGRRPEFASHP